MWEAPKLRASVGFIQILLNISKSKDFFRIIVITIIIIIIFVRHLNGQKM